jgi:hypothetical protein
MAAYSKGKAIIEQNKNNAKTIPKAMQQVRARFLKRAGALLAEMR